MKQAVSILSPLEMQPVQAYFSNRIQISQIIDWVLAQIGQASVAISTFSVSEEFIRHIFRLKADGLIGHCSLFCDIRAARKTLNLYNFIRSVFDEVFLCQNHSKVILFAGASKKVVVITSQNLTRGDRFECGVISSIPEMTSLIEDSLQSLKLASNPLNELL